MRAAGSIDKSIASARLAGRMRIYGGIQHGHSRGDHRTEFCRRLDAGGDRAGAGAAPGGDLFQKRGNRQGIRGKYHLDAVFTDLEAFAASDAFDAAYIASPNICHFEQAMCLLRHGKHVLLESRAF